jgi:hypothetical protein
MVLAPGIARLTADGQVGPASKDIRIFWIHLVSGGTASVASLKLGTSTSGDAYAQIDGTANSGVTVNFGGGLLFPGDSGGCYFDADANISYCTIGYGLE